MFIELKLQIAQSPIGAVYPVEKNCHESLDVAPLELRGRIGFFL